MDRKPNGQFLPGTHWRKPQLFRDRSWLENHYTKLQMSAAEIAAMFGVTAEAITFWLKRYAIPRRTVAEARSIKHWGCAGVDNPMWNRKGELNPNWKGGITPERQAFYQSFAWKKVCQSVWRRDKATCQRCGLKKDDSPDMPFHIHHIASFAIKALRCLLPNLVLLCETCHQFVHSRRNVNNEYLRQ